MSTYKVDAVRKGWSSSRNHKHIEGVWVGTAYYDRETVVRSIAAGNTWKTEHAGYSATIHPVRYCPHPTCLANPYIQTNPDSTREDNLENLPDKDR